MKLDDPKERIWAEDDCEWTEQRCGELKREAQSLLADALGRDQRKKLNIERVKYRQEFLHKVVRPSHLFEAANGGETLRERQKRLEKAGYYRQQWRHTCIEAP